MKLLSNHFHYVWIIFVCFLLIGCKKNTISNKSEMTDPYLSGNSFRSIAHFIYDETRKDSIANKIQPADIVFVKGNLLEEFFISKHPTITVPYILITHNSDVDIDEKFLPYLEDKKILHWFAQNVNIYHAKLTPIPIGIHIPNFALGKCSNITRAKKIFKNRAKFHLVYMNFNASNCAQERQMVFSLFQDKNFCYIQNIKKFLPYLDDLTQCKFVLSPRGNGLDCHRTWEALYLGCIPIVKTSPMDPVFKDLPVLIIQDWNDVTEDFLCSQYDQVLQRKVKEKKLYFPYWKKKILRISQQYKKAKVL